MKAKRDKVTEDVQAMLNRAWPAVQAILKQRNKKKPRNARGPLDEKEQRRNEMLRKKLPLPGQMALFDDK